MSLWLGEEAVPPVAGLWGQSNRVWTSGQIIIYQVCPHRKTDFSTPYREGLNTLQTLQGLHGPSEPERVPDTAVSAVQALTHG